MTNPSHPSPRLSGAVRVLVVALVAFCGLLPLATFADSSTDSTTPPKGPVVDPARYLKLEWIPRESPGGTGKVVQLHDPTEPLPDVSEVVGRAGKLRIDFDREKMKKVWDFDTSASLSVRGFKKPADGTRENIEIPGYSSIGEKLRVVELDLGAAGTVVGQLFQGSRLAHRIVAAADKARGAELREKLVALNRALEAETGLLEETERALIRVYQQALRFALEARDVEEAAAIIAEAEKELEAVLDPAAAGRLKRLEVFGRELAKHRGTIDAWLAQLSSPANLAYLPIIGQLVQRDPQLIRSATSEIASQLKAWDGDLTINERSRIMDRFVTVANYLIDIERDLYQRYVDLKNSGTKEWKNIVESEQYKCRYKDEPKICRKEVWPEGTGGQSTVPILCQFADAVAIYCEEKNDRDDPPDSVDLPDGIAATLAEERISAIDALLDQLSACCGKDGERAEFKAEIRRKFETQIQRTVDEIEELEARRHGFEKDYKNWRDQKDVEQKDVEVDTCYELRTLADLMETILMVEVIHKLIDAIPATTLSLDTLNLTEGDQLGIEVSLLPRPGPEVQPPPQLTCTFHVVPWGWRGPGPRVVDDVQVSFVQPEVGGDFQPSFGTSAYWNWHGKSRSRKSAARFWAPGVGISALLLDADGEESSIEVGLGVTFSVFDNLLHFTYGWNLQKEFPKEVDDPMNGMTPAMEDGSREYWAVGISLKGIVDKLKPDKD